MSTSQFLEFPKLGWGFEINRVAFSIAGFPIYWYAVMITAGMLLAFWFAFQNRPKFGIEANTLLDAGLFGIIGGIVGARVYYVLFSLNSFTNFWSVFNLRDGGLAIYGGVIGALAAVTITARVKKAKLTPLLDVGVLGLLIGQSIGRWGNFFNVEAFGSNTNLPWGMTSDEIQSYLILHGTDIELSGGGTVVPELPVHPCFLYESLWCALGLFLLWLYTKKRKFDGEISLFYLVWYGVGRFFIESLRTDSLTIGRLRVSMALSGLAAVSALVVWIIIRSLMKSNLDENKYVLYVNRKEADTT